MKKLSVVIFAAVIILTAIIIIKNCSGADGAGKSWFLHTGSGAGEFNAPETTDALKSGKSSHELRGVWLSCYEIGDLCSGKSENEYRSAVEKLTDRLAENKINTVFYQARAFCDALYDSDIFPQSRYMRGSDGTETAYDALGVFIECAKKANIAVHAWVNPFRVSYNSDIGELPADSPATELANDGGAHLIICADGIYLNPADSRSRRLILDGIRELISHYGIAGIHFDDYFYPDCAFDDGESFNEYKKSGGLLSTADWRRANISDFVASVYALVKEQNPELVFGISPAASFENCRNKLFADIEKWCGAEGYIDYICPQIYFGFENETAPFEKKALEWAQRVNTDTVELYCGLAAYKCGRTDKNAGSGANEWLVNSDILARQYEFLQKIGVYSGYCLFSYSYAFGKNAIDNSNTELKKLSDMLQ